MRGVDQLIGHAELDGKLPRRLQIAASPVAIAVDRLDALNDDQQVRVDGEDGVAAPLGGQAPILGRVACTPVGGVIWLVVQVAADDGVVAGVAGRQRGPVADPALLGVAAVVPQGGPVVGVEAVPVEDDLEAPRLAPGDEFVHDLRPGQPPQVRVQPVVDAAGRAASVEELVAVGNADAVVAQRPDLVEDRRHGAHA